MIMKLKIEEIEGIYVEAKDKVRVSCDDYHAHSAIGGCVVGDKDAVTICKLCETIINLRAHITGAINIIEEALDD